MSPSTYPHLGLLPCYLSAFCLSTGRKFVLSRTCYELQIAVFLSLLVHPMSHQRTSSSSPSDGAGEEEPYRDSPTASPPQTADIRSLDINDTEPSEAPRLSFGSSVGLIPTPGTVSQRHPTYVRHHSRLMRDCGPSFILLFRYVGAVYATNPCRNCRLCSACSSGDCFGGGAENLGG
jgi:hypothetical protein